MFGIIACGMAWLNLRSAGCVDRGVGASGVLHSLGLGWHKRRRRRERRRGRGHRRWRVDRDGVAGRSNNAGAASHAVNVRRGVAAVQRRVDCACVAAIRVKHGDLHDERSVHTWANEGDSHGRRVEGRHGVLGNPEILAKVDIASKRAHVALRWRRLLYTKQYGSYLGEDGSITGLCSRARS